MSLIKCPECHKEISDESKQCIHCGYPLSKNTICNINGYEYDLSFVLNTNLTETQKMNKLHFLTKIPKYKCRLLVFACQKDNKIPSHISIPIESSNQNKCPKCGSTEFTPVRKKFSLLTGFATNKVELICNKCGTKIKK